MADNATPAEPTQGQASYDDALSRARSAAMSKLRESHRDEYQRTITALMKEAGHDWKPRPTALEKAQKQLEELLASHPELAVKVVPPREG